MLPSNSQSDVYTRISVRLLLCDLGRRAACVLFATALLSVGNGKAQEKADQIDVLIWQLKSSNSDMRIYAANRLARIGPGAIAAVPYLIIAIGDQNRDVRRFAAFAIWRIQPKTKDVV